jgi:ATPase subunit of ABC transporter with duplicated ATPase domains
MMCKRQRSTRGLWREYFGGYDDYLRQSASEKSILEADYAKAKLTTKSEAAPPQRNNANNKPRKLSFKEARELEAYPRALKRWKPNTRNSWKR